MPSEIIDAFLNAREITIFPDIVGDGVVTCSTIIIIQRDLSEWSLQVSEGDDTNKPYGLVFRPDEFSGTHSMLPVVWKMDEVVINEFMLTHSYYGRESRNCRISSFCIRYNQLDWVRFKISLDYPMWFEVEASKEITAR